MVMHKNSLMAARGISHVNMAQPSVLVSLFMFYFRFLCSSLISNGVVGDKQRRMATNLPFSLLCPEVDLEEPVPYTRDM